MTRDWALEVETAMALCEHPTTQPECASCETRQRVVVGILTDQIDAALASLPSGDGDSS